MYYRIKEKGRSKDSKEQTFTECHQSKYMLDRFRCAYTISTAETIQYTV